MRWRGKSRDQVLSRALSHSRNIDYIISAKLTQALQSGDHHGCPLVGAGDGLELAEIAYQAQGWDRPRRIVLVRQSVKRRVAPVKTLYLFADDPDISGWRYGAMVTGLGLPMMESGAAIEGAPTARIGSRNSRPILGWTVSA